jgi:hypothetical protein
MIPPTRPDDEISEIDVRYGIDDCRKRLRNQRAVLRSQQHPPTDVSNDFPSGNEAVPKSYAEILAHVSLNQSSLSRLVECLLEPVDEVEQTTREEAVLT